MDYSLIMLEELQKLENLSEDYKGELKFLSKKIRKLGIYSVVIGSTGMTGPRGEIVPTGPTGA